MRRFLVFCIVLLAGISTFSFEADFQFTQNFYDSVFPNKIRVGLDHSYNDFDFTAALYASNDGKYQSSMGDYYKGYYFFLDKGGLIFTPGNLSFSFGRLNHKDEVDSPYSLFISSNYLPAVIGDIRFEDTVFFYNSRWIRLNARSSCGYPDRGANYKTYGLKFSNIRFGFQDSTVYVGRSFDEEHFLSPIPGFFTQYVNTSQGKPWSVTGDENSILGFFMDYRDSLSYYYWQILVDDLNVNRFMFPDRYQNPDKVAWSLGGNKQTVIGRIGFYHAGSTKYTFEPSGGAAVDTKYGYTYYPDTVYTADSKERTIEYEDNYIGFKYGENTAAFILNYTNTFDRFNLYADCEYRVSGSKSPANPWQEYLTWDQGGQGTHFLDESILEKAFLSRIKLSTVLYGLKISAGCDLGMIFNKLELTDIPPEYYNSAVNKIKYFKPSSNNESILKFHLSLEYNLNLL